MTARAKGLTERRVLYGHVFRNAMLIVIAGFPSAFVGILFTGALLTEIIFSLDGLGLLGFEAALGRDYPVMFATPLLLHPARPRHAAGGRPRLYDHRSAHRLREPRDVTAAPPRPAAPPPAPEERVLGAARLAPGPPAAAQLPPQPARVLEPVDIPRHLRAEPARRVHRQRQAPARVVRRRLVRPGAARLPRDRIRRRLRDRGGVPRPVRPGADRRGRRVDPVAADPVQIRHGQHGARRSLPGAALGGELARHRRPGAPTWRRG